MKRRPRYPGLFLFALLVAFFLWYAVAGQRRERISERQVTVPLTLVNIPPDLVITNNVPETVSLRLRGALSRILADGDSMQVVLDLAGAEPGSRTFPVKPAQIKLPPDVTVVSIDPPEIELHLERLQVRQVPVTPVIEGEPAPGFEVTGVRTVPSSLAVRGPESLVTDLEEVETTPVRVDGATGPVEAAAQTRLAHPLLRSLSGVPVLVIVDIGPAPTPTPTPVSRRRRR